MAGVYTTKRGKNKKGKLGQRKDAANNAANKLTQAIKGDPLANALFSESKEIQTLAVGSSQEHRRKLALERVQEKLKEKEAQKLLLAAAAQQQQAQTTESQSQSSTSETPATKTSTNSSSSSSQSQSSSSHSISSQQCQYSQCKNDSNSQTSAPRKLLQCGGCRSVSYCSVECQKSDWPHHKLPCKATQSLMKTFGMNNNNNNTNSATNSNSNTDSSSADLNKSVEDLSLKT